MKPLTIFVAGLAHETNSFSPLPTSLRSFAEDVFYQPPDPAGREQALAFAGYGDAIAAARAAGDTVIEGPCFWTQPSGPISAALYAELSGAIVEAVRAAGSVDAVVLNLHGAMMADGVDDCEGDLLARLRAAIGPDVPLGALLDLHGNVTPAMVASGAVLVGVKEYPHSDYRERSVELHTLLTASARCGARYATTLRTVPLLSLQGTTEAPMRALVARLKEAEGRPGIRSVTMMHGFPWSDMADAGAAVLVVSDADVDSGPLADELAEEFIATVTAAPPERLGVEATLDRAFAMPGVGPIVIADASDNPGGGAACDSTFMLRALIERGAECAALGMIWDPQAARIAADAGVGATLRLRVGGKVGAMSGDPVDITAEVIAVRDDLRQRFFGDDHASPLGLAAGLRVGGVELVVNSVRQQVFGPECFTQLGIDLASKAAVVVKSTQHFRRLFDPIARATLTCAAPGTFGTDLSLLPYTRLRVHGDGPTFAVDRAPTTFRWPHFSTESVS